MYFSLLLSGLIAVSPFASASTCTTDNLVIKTSSGEVHGFINNTAPDVRQFLGIPYAEAPVGDLRFAPPQTKKRGAAINATYYGASCMQQTSTAKTIYTEYDREFLINGPTSEDCLFVHVWAPNNAQKGLPVFLYIPGGGFTGGGTNSPYKFPHHWVQQTQSHIVVIMNYRLNVFGYPNAREAHFNYGLMDQRKAVEWTYANIGKFGGDPSRITLWGQSAGGSSASVYGLANYEQPLVSGIIADSGASIIGVSQDVARSNFTFLAGQLGCGNMNATGELACMRKVDATTLAQTLSNYTNSGAVPAIRFVPVDDGKTAFGNATARILEGKVANIPYIMGSNSNEGAGFISNNITYQGPGQTALDTIGDQLIICPIAREIRARSSANLTTYRYEYTGNFSNISPLPWIAATHSAELPLLFGTHDDFRNHSTRLEYATSATMQNLWLDFANDPSMNPSYGAFEWTPTSNTDKRTALFASSDMAVQSGTANHIDDRCASGNRFGY